MTKRENSRCDSDSGSTNSCKTSSKSSSIGNPLCLDLLKIVDDFLLNNHGYFILGSNHKYDKKTVPLRFAVDSLR